MPAALLMRADFAELSRLVEWLDERIAALGLDERQAYALRLCVEELAGNVMMHAGAGAMRVTMEATPLTLMIEDDGPAFDISAVPEPVLPATLEAATVGGLGLLLTRRYSRDLTYRREDGWNRVTVRL